MNMKNEPQVISPQRAQAPHRIVAVPRHEQLPTVRLLKLAPSAQPNDDEARLECELTEVALDCDSGSNTNTPSYEALSYSWDAQVPEVPVLCNGARLKEGTVCVHGEKKRERVR